MYKNILACLSLLTCALLLGGCMASRQPLVTVQPVYSIMHDSKALEALAMDAGWSSSTAVAVAPER